MLADSDLDFEVYSICFVILIYIHHSKDLVYIIAPTNKRPIVDDVILGIWRTNIYLYHFQKI